MCFAAYYSPWYGRCTPLSRESTSETTLTAGTSVTFAASSTLQVSVAALDTERAVVCYEDSGNSGYGTCQRLWMDGASLVVGSAVEAEPSNIGEFSVAALDSGTALFCYLSLIHI